MSDVSDSNNTSAVESLEGTEDEYEFEEEDDDPQYCAAGGGGLVKKRKPPRPPDYGPAVKAGPSVKKVDFEAPTSDTDDNDMVSRRNRGIDVASYTNMDKDNLKNILSV